MAASYEKQGADEIVFLDISASPKVARPCWTWWRETAKRLFVPLTVGGGIRSQEDMRAALNAGADKVSDQHRGRAAPGDHHPNAPRTSARNASSWP